MKLKNLIILFLAVIQFSGCSWQSYDEDNPQEYKQYWNNEHNLEYSIPDSFGAEIITERDEEYNEYSDPPPER